jgi:1-acyl-sn-glycerol-3-phosphate acyltransferase
MQTTTVHKPKPRATSSSMEPVSPKRFIQAVFWWFLRLHSYWVLALGRLLYRLEIQGREHLPSKGPLLVVCRHSSRIEVFAVALFCIALREFYGLAAGPVMANNRLFLWLSRELGMTPSFKERGVSASGLLYVCKLLQQGKIIVMAADGEVPWDGRPQRLRPGAAWLALRTGTPLVAVRLLGGYDVWPRWASRPHLTGKLTIKIGQQFSLGDAPCKRITEAMIQRANERLMAELEALSPRQGFHMQDRAREHA